MMLNRNSFADAKFVALIALAFFAVTFGRMGWAAYEHHLRDGAQLALAAAKDARLQNPRIYQPSCDHPESKDEMDTCAQSRMADVAERMYALTVVQLIVGFVGLLGLVATFIANAITAKAAVDSAATARTALVGLERPYLFIDAVALTVVDGPPRKSVRFELTWKNAGNRPAKNLVRMNNSAVVFGQMSADYRYPDFGELGLPPAGALGADMSLGGGTIDIPFDAIGAVVSGQLSIHLWGWIEYDGIVSGGSRYRTEFSTKVLLHQISGDQFRSEYIVFGPYNRMDEDCPSDSFRTLRGGVPNPTYVPAPIPPPATWPPNPQPEA